MTTLKQMVVRFVQIFALGFLGMAALVVVYSLPQLVEQYLWLN